MLKNLKLGTKLIGGFGLVALLAGLIGGIGLVSVSRLGAALESLSAEVTEPLGHAGEVAAATQRGRNNLQTMIRYNDPARIEDQIKRFEEREAEVVTALEAAEKAVKDEAVLEHLKDYRKEDSRYEAASMKIVALARANRDAEAYAVLDGELYNAVQDLQKTAAEIVDALERQDKRLDETNGALIKRSETLMILLMVAGFAAAMLIGFFLSRSITGPLARGAGMMTALSRGQLNARLHMDRGDEIGTLATGMDHMADSLQKLLEEDGGMALQAGSEKVLTRRVTGEYAGSFQKLKNAINTMLESMDKSMMQVAVGAEQVASASEQIGSGSQALAQGASEQASSLEEISSSLQEMTSMTKQNTANAREAKGLSDAAKKGADKGVANMKNLSGAVDRIKKSADDTAKIVKTIDEIAFQTNLLALNAAVEAARAGDAGKGFAVVAEEVRNLAMRSAEAAKNTANLIEESVKNAENGVALNGEVLKNFEEINTQATKVSEVMAEIAAASEQQAQGIDQVNTAVQQMNSLTQQSAANSEESASAAQQLSSQAQEMQAMVGSFKTTGGADLAQKRLGHQARPAARQAARPQLGANRKVNPASVIPFDDGKDGLKSF